MRLDPYAIARGYLPGEQLEREGEAPQALPVERAILAPLTI
jgi:hypothetical protein